MQNGFVADADGGGAELGFSIDGMKKQVLWIFNPLFHNYKGNDRKSCAIWIN